MFFRKSILAGLTGLLLISACKNEDNKNASQAQSMTVKAVRVEPHNVPLSFEYAARAQGSKETQVRARVGGILLKRNYTEGATVKAGDVLFEIDTAPYKVALAQAKAQLAQSRAQLKSAQNDWDRISTLFKQHVVSEKSRDDSLAALDTAKASVQAAQAQVDQAQLNLDYTTVTAPISGVTSMEAQSEGSLISATGESSLLTNITQVDPIYVIFSASESEILSLTAMTDKGLISNPLNGKDIIARVKFGNDLFYPLTGKINFINPTIDESTGTIKLRAVFPNPEGRLRPGQFLRLVMEGLVRQNAIVVPEEAVMQGANGAFVYRVSDRGTIETVNVKTGFTTKDQGWIIDEGLHAGDVVVISDLMKLRQGIPVKADIVTQKTPADALDDEAEA